MSRKAKIQRKTKETNISVEVNLDGKGKYQIKTKIGFLDHMLEQLSKHSLIDMKISAKGDTHIDLHHTTEDTGIALGEAIKKAAGNLKGIKRYASAMIPMDETLSRVSLDVSNRPYLIWKVDLIVEKLAIQIHSSGDKPDLLIGIARGGLPIIDVLSRIFKLKCAYLAVESYSGKGIEDKVKSAIVNGI